MKFVLRITPGCEETVTAEVKERSRLTDEIEALVRSAERGDEIIGYDEDNFPAALKYADIECFCAQDGRTWAVCATGKRCRLRESLSAVEQRLPPDFIRINKSAIAARRHIRRFKAAVTGGVDVIFESGHSDYVSRRCLADLKRRITEK